MNEAQTYQTEFHTEDAFVAYLSGVLPSGVYVGPSLSTVDYVEPGVYVAWHEVNNVSDDAGFTGHVAGMVKLTIRVHANIASNDEAKTSRQQLGELYSRVVYHLAKTDLKDLLNANISAHASIDQAILEPRMRGVDPEANAFEALVNVGVIARAVDA